MEKNYCLRELECVEETRHLVPNLEILARALFGDHAHLTSKAPYQADWATGKMKVGDGLLWLPWSKQLWLIEVEWKDESNLFDQLRSFARGKVDKDKLRAQLEEILGQFEDVLNRAASTLREGLITRNIIEETLRIHVDDESYLKPHGWIILGHSGNREKLRAKYEAELKVRFGAGRHYILSTARMFCNPLSSYILLEQFCSEGCRPSIEHSILVPAVLPSVEKRHIERQAEPYIPRVSELPGRRPTPRGRAAQCWFYLAKIDKKLSPEHVRLRLQFNSKTYIDFDVDWSDPGHRIRVISKDGKSRGPARAAKDHLGGRLPKIYYDVASEIGVFIDVSKSPPQHIVNYRDIKLSAQRNKEDIVRRGVPDPQSYFASITPYKGRKILENISGRKDLWEFFIKNRQMTPDDFKKYSEFRSKAISGFIKFILNTGIASKSGNIFALNGEAVPHIQRFLPDENGQIPLPDFNDPASLEYLKTEDRRIREMINKNILGRSELWEVFLRKKVMRVEGFKEHSQFKPKSVAGFMYFLTNSGLALRFGDFFILNEAVIPEIQRLLKEGM